MISVSLTYMSVDDISLRWHLKGKCDTGIWMICEDSTAIAYITAGRSAWLKIQTCI